MCYILHHHFKIINPVLYKNRKYTLQPKDRSSVDTMFSTEYFQYFLTQINNIQNYTTTDAVLTTKHIR